MGAPTGGRVHTKISTGHHNVPIIRGATVILILAATAGLSLDALTVHCAQYDIHRLQHDDQ
ncbi:MAG: hypothetical protein AAGC86_00580 [Pseudomonadota bacterium]